MANETGIEKVGLRRKDDPGVYKGSGVKYPRHVCLIGGAAVSFEAEYYAGVSKIDKSTVKWIASDDSRLFTSKDAAGLVGEIIDVKVLPKYCGVISHAIEAFTKEPKNKYPTRISIGGYSENKIISAKWSKALKGSDISNGSPIKYGDPIFLFLETEGLNGNLLCVDIFNDEWGTDNIVQTYTNVRCINGEVNLHIKNTFSWKKNISFQESVEGFYVKVRLQGRRVYLKNKTEDYEVAKFLKIENKISSEKVEPSTNNKVLTTGKKTIELKRYEPCKFRKIEIKDGDDTIVLFDEVAVKTIDHKIKNIAHLATIHYDFDKWEILPKAKPVLDKVANFLKEVPYVPIELGSHTDSFGTDQYNAELSEKRAKSAIKYLIDKGVNPNIITAKGYGESKPLIKKDVMTPEEHALNRRTEILFKIEGHDARSLYFETIAPAYTALKPKQIVLTVDGLATDKCLQKSLEDKHEEKIAVYDITDNEFSKKTKSASPLTHKVYSSLPVIDTIPIFYIWPINTAQNHFFFHVNTCRYYTDVKVASVVVNVYPDIKWTFTFSFEMSQALAKTWEGQTPARHKALQEEAGKRGAAARWQYADVKCSFGLKTEWNKLSGDNYQFEKECKHSYESKFKKLHDVFASIGAISKGITNKTGGAIKKTSKTKKTYVFTVLTPVIAVEIQWQLARAELKNNKTTKIGTQIDINLKADPLIGVELEIDLIAGLVGAAATAASGGTATVGVTRLFTFLREKVNEGVEIGDADEFGMKASGDIYIDLKITSVINIKGGVSFNTVGDQTKFPLEVEGKLKVELSAGVWGKAEIAIVVVKAEGYFEVSLKGTAGITHKSAFTYDARGLYYKPELGFDGLIVKYVIIKKLGLSSTKSQVKRDKNAGINPAKNTEDEFKDGKVFGTLIEPFDLMKSLEQTFGFDSNIGIIKNDEK